MQVESSLLSSDLGQCLGVFSFSSEDLVLSLEDSSCFLRLGVLSWSCCHCVESLLWQAAYGAATFSFQEYVCTCLAAVPETKVQCGF